MSYEKITYAFHKRPSEREEDFMASRSLRGNGTDREYSTEYTNNSNNDCDNDFLSLQQPQHTLEFPYYADKNHHHHHHQQKLEQQQQ